MTVATKNRQILLVSRPVGDIQDSDFEQREAEVPDLADGQILARNLYLSLDPAMRGWMSDREDSYVPPVPLGDVMRGGTIAEVVESKHPDYAPGDKVFGMGGWQDYAVHQAPMLPTKLPAELPLPLTNFLSVLGITGLTAYFGLLDITNPQAGETVVVSTAAGAVGSIVGQIAKIKGCHVVGIAGTDEKCAWIRDELGFDSAINYHNQDVADALRKTCPNGIDVYFDNVGGEILNTVLGMINVGARVSICGAITRYNATEELPGPSNYLMLLLKRAKMEGFIVMDFAAKFPEASMQIAQWVMEGKLKFKEHVVDGLENAPQAIQMLFSGENKGKLMIKIAEPSS